MREGIYFSFDTERRFLCTGFIVHYYKGLVVRQFTSCSLAFVVVQALSQASNHGLSHDEIPMYECKALTVADRRRAMEVTL